MSTDTERAVADLEARHEALSRRLQAARAVHLNSTVQERLSNAWYVRFEHEQQPGYQEPDYWTFRVSGLFDGQGFLIPNWKDVEDLDPDEIMDSLRPMVEDNPAVAYKQATFVWDLREGRLDLNVELLEAPPEDAHLVLAQRSLSALADAITTEVGPQGAGLLSLVGEVEKHVAALSGTTGDQ